jgi:hypothetical protein
VFGELAGGEVVAEFPTVAHEHEEGSHRLARCDGVGEAHDIKRDLLFRGAAGLLPPERHEDVIVPAACRRLAASTILGTVFSTVWTTLLNTYAGGTNFSCASALKRRNLR